jgi:hypothetical protein
MTPIALFLLLQTFSHFSYCRENSRGPYEFQCVELNAEGRGGVRFKRREAEAIRMDIQLSPAAASRFLAVVAGTNYLADGDSYESPRKVADLGLKRLVIETPSGRREASFNFSQRKEVMDLVAFFEGLVNQETLTFDINTALQFERLSIPKRLDQIEKELQSNRIADPARLIPLLEKIEKDQRLMNIARTRAGKIKMTIEH